MPYGYFIGGTLFVAVTPAAFSMLQVMNDFQSYPHFSIPQTLLRWFEGCRLHCVHLERVSENPSWAADEIEVCWRRRQANACYKVQAGLLALLCSVK